MRNFLLKFLYQTAKIFSGILSAIIILFLLPVLCFGDETIDSKGKDFLLTFLPNFHNDRTKPNATDSLYLFITSETSNKGIIEFIDSLGKVSAVNFTIKNPGDIYTYKTTFYGHELIGVDSRNGEKGYCERATYFSYHIRADEDAVVYGHDQATITSDAFMVYPTDVLGTAYYILSYNSDMEKINNPATPSQFAIVAVEDSTIVNIRPSCETNFHSDKPFSTLLNRGQVYLVQANTIKNNDLSGTFVSSTKPVAVFSGHQRATIPYINNYNPGTRDCLIEQMPPLTSWGKNAFLTPFVKPSNVSNQDSDIYRIIAAFDNTNLYLDGDWIATLDAGVYYEGALTLPGEISSNNPILVAQYKKTSGAHSGPANGDPFMMIIPPKEQYLNSYRIINVQAYENKFGNVQEVYTEHFLTVVLPDASIPRIVLDGKNIDAKIFAPIPGTGYSYANVPVKAGVHELECDDNFGLNIYGYGSANSYGYIGGMGFRALNSSPPSIAYSDSCFAVAGNISDALYGSAVIMETGANAADNVVVNIGSFAPPASNVPFTIQIVDIRKDGYCEIFAKDKFDSVIVKAFDIPGFTVAVEKFELSDKLPEVYENIKTGLEFCFDVALHNYGKFSQDISEFFMKNGKEFTVKNKPPAVLAPGETATARICFYSDYTGLFSDTLKIKNECAEIPLLFALMNAGDDEGPPEVYSAADSCFSEKRYVITDSLKSDYGVGDIVFTDSTNCSVYNKITTPSKAEFTVKIINPYLDAIYGFTVTDKAGNIIEIQDTIQGFTVRFPDFKEKEPFIDFGESPIGAVTFDTLRILNVGLLPITINEARLSHNIYFSVPPSQLPFTILPGETKSLAACFNIDDVFDSPVTDSIKLFQMCNFIVCPLSGNGAEIARTTESRCKTPIRIDVEKTAKNYFLDPAYPNPMFGGAGKIRFGMPEKSKISIRIYSANGIPEADLLNGTLEAGLYEAEYDLSEIPQGVYFIEFTANGARFFQKLFVVR